MYVRPIERSFGPTKGKTYRYTPALATARPIEKLLPRTSPTAIGDNADSVSEHSLVTPNLERAQQRLGFDYFLPEVEEVLKDHKQQQKVKPPSVSESPQYAEQYAGT